MMPRGRPKKKKEDKKQIEFRQEVIDLALKCGFSQQQIEAFDSEESIKAAIMLIKPQYLNQLQEQEPPKPKPFVAVGEPKPTKGEPPPTKMKELYEFEIVRSAGQLSGVRRCDMEDNELWSKLRIAGIQQSKVTKITLERDFIPVKGNLITKVNVEFKKGI